jgi:putative pyruvate formate lyase activating enzyme
MTIKSATRQSDIVITADGKIHISFLWDDLADLALPSAEEVYPALSWTPPLTLPVFSLTEYESCELCPKACGFNRVSSLHPTCGDEKLRVSNSGLSLGDEREIRGTRGSGIIMLSGCPLTCPSCHNPEKVAHGNETSPQEFMGLCADLLAQGAHNIQILSPTVHLPALRMVLQALKDSGFPLPVIFKSSGYESVSELKKLKGLVDVYLPDFKFGSCSEWGKKSGVKDYFEQSTLAIEEMRAQTGAAVLDANGLITRGVLIRHVEAPLPVSEKKQIKDYLDGLKDVIISYQDTFTDLEG